MEKEEDEEEEGEEKGNVPLLDEFDAAAAHISLCPPTAVPPTVPKFC